MSKSSSDSTVQLKLGAIACARSGDKGSSSNIGVIARTPAGFQFLKNWLTADRVLEYFKPLGPTGIQSHVFPKLGAMNFTLEGVLAGGGSRSLRIDAQGKALAQALLEMDVEVPADTVSTLVS